MDAAQRDALILEHLPLVARLTNKYAWDGVDKETIYQEGCYGLILAVDRYVPTKGASLSTFASYYIIKHILKSLREDHCGMKEKSARKSRECRAAANALAEDLGRKPSVQEIAETAGIDYSDTYAYTVIGQDRASLEMLPEIFAPHTSDRCVEDDVLGRLNELCLDDFNVPLTSTEIKAIYLRFGFGEMGAPLTYQQIADALGVSEPTATAYCKTAISKLQRAAAIA